MPREIRTTLAVDGEAAFKRAISEANTSMRNLGTQLTLAQANFRKDGDAMKLMESRSKALNAEISQQNEIVKALEKAVQDSTKAYGENSEKTERWQAELNRARTHLINLQNELTLNDAGLDRNGKAFEDSTGKAADYNATLQQIGKNVSFDAITSGVDSITGKIRGAITAVLGFAKSVREAFADAGEWADNLSSDALRYGLSVEDLQRWQWAADFVDTSVETIFNARDKLNTKMKESWTDNGIDMWEFLGINRFNEDGSFRDQMDVMWEAGETLMNLAKIDGNTVRAEKYSMELFGKSWRDLIPLFTAGREEWQKYMEESQVVSEERVKNLNDLNDANDRLANTWDVTKYSFLAELSPVITEVTEAVTGMLAAWNEWMDTDEGKKAMEDLSAAIQSLFSGLSDLEFSDIINTVKDAINSIKDALLWISNNKDHIYDALKIIGAGFVAMELTGVVANLGKIVTNFQTIWAGGGMPTGNVGNAMNASNTVNGALAAANVLNNGKSTALVGNSLIWGGAVASKLFGLGEAATAALLLYPMFDKVINEGLDSINPFGEMLNQPSQFEQNILDEYGEERGKEISGEYKAAAGEAFKQDTGVAIIDENFNQPELQRNTLRRLWTKATGRPVEYEDVPEREHPLYSKIGGALTGQIGELSASFVEALRNSNGGLADVYDTLRGYTNLGGDMDEMSRLAEDFFDWWEGDAENGTMDQLADLMNDSQFAEFLRSMEAFRSGEGALDGDIDAFLDPLRTVLTLIEEYAATDHPETLSGEDMTGSITELQNAAADLRANTEAARIIADRVAGADLRAFNSLPGQIQAAAQNGTAAGINGIRVYLDGSTVGRLVAPYVSAIIAQSVGG